VTGNPDEELPESEKLLVVAKLTGVLAQRWRLNRQYV
jgi:hypothetical protein